MNDHATQTPVPTPGGEASVGTGHPRVFNAIDRAILEFERGGRWKYAGLKQREVRDRFAMSEVRYYQVLNWIIEQPEAREYDAQTVDRLIRLRDRRRDVRTVGTAAAGVDTRNDLRGVRPALGGVL